MEMLSSVTSALIAKALDIAQLQHGLIANNIANAQTEGYRPYRLDFKTLMGDLESIVEKQNDDSTAAEIRAFDSNGYVEVDEMASRVLLDKEMVALTENTVHYQALLTAKSKLGKIMKTAISGAR